MKNQDALRLLTILGSIKPEPDTKLQRAIESTLENAAPFIKAYNKKLIDLDIEYCETNEKGHILKDQHGNRIFTKEGQRQLIVATELFMQDDVSLSIEIVPVSEGKGIKDFQIGILEKLGFIRKKID